MTMALRVVTVWCCGGIHNVTQLYAVWSASILGNLLVNCGWAWVMIPKPHRRRYLVGILVLSFLPASGTWCSFMDGLIWPHDPVFLAGEPARPMNLIVFSASLAVMSLALLGYAWGINMLIRHDLARRGLGQSAANANTQPNS
jgi:hypothetical protein